MIDNITTDLLCHIVTGGLNAIHSSVFYHNVVKSILDNTGINVNKIIVNPDSNNENEILKILSERGVNIGSVGECTFLDIAINYGLKQIIKQLENSGGKTYKKYYGAAHYQEFVDLNFHQNNRPSTQTSDNSQNNTNSNELTEIPDFLNLIPNSYSNSTDGQGRTTGLNSNQNNQLST